MHFESIFDLIHKGGFTVYILVLCSIISLKVAIDKLIQFQGINLAVLDEIIYKTKDFIRSKKIDEAKEFLKTISWKRFGIRYTCPLSTVYLFMLDNSHLAKDELEEVSFNKLDKEMVKLEKGLGIHATLGSITPFIGLFGTVIGIIKSFSALSLQDAGNYSSVISGIAEALVATAAGLFVAIPSVMFYNYFMKRLKLNQPSFDGAVRELLLILK